VDGYDMPVIPFKEKIPVVSASAFVAPLYLVHPSSKTTYFKQDW
jgi:hypothetical protein